MNCPNANWNWPKKTKILQKLITISTPNWSAKGWIAICSLFGVGLLSCEAPKEIGLPPEKIVSVDFIDTVTVRASTVLLDSVRTSGAVSLLAGSYKDPVFGKVTAQPYFEVGSPFALDSTKAYTYDSLTFTVAYTYFWGDTLKPFELSLHRLTDTIRTNKIYYNNSSIDYEPTPIATVKVNPTPQLTRLLTFKLPNSLGKQIFDLSGKDEVSSADKFIKKFKGFTLVSNTSNSLAIGTNSLGLNLYVHVTGDSVVQLKTFSIIRRFNNVKADRRGTALSQIQPLKALTPAQTNGMAYIQDALGVVTKIDFPYIDKVLNNPEIAINRAELKIVPNENPTDGVNFINQPIGLMLAETDDSNRLLRSKNDIELLLNNDTETFQSYVRPQLVPYASKFKSYEFILTTYLQAILTGFKKSKGLLLIPASEINSIAGIQSTTAKYYPYINTRLDRLTITPNKDNLKLYLFYTASK